MQKALAYTVLALLWAVQPHRSFAQKQGQEYIDSVERELPGMKDDTNKVNVLNGLAEAYNKIKKTDEGKAISGQSIQLATNLDWKKGQADAYLDLGIVCRTSEEHQLAFDNLNKALKLYKSLGIDKGIAKTLRYIALVFQAQGKYDQSIETYRQAIKICEKTGEKTAIAKNYASLGETYVWKSDDLNAIKNLQYSLKLFEQLDDKEGESVALLNMGDCLRAQNNTDSVLSYYLQALKADERTANNEHIVYVYGQLADFYCNNGNFDQAEDYATKALKLSRQQKTKGGTATALTMLEKVYKGQKKFVDALKTSDEALALLNEVGTYKDAYAFELDSRSEIYETIYRDSTNRLPKLFSMDKNKALENAIDYRIKSVAIYEQLGSIPDLGFVSGHLSTLYGEKKDYKNALKYKTLSDSLYFAFYDKANTKAIAEIKEKYESEKKNNSIALLNKDKTASEAKLRTQNYLLGGTFLLVILSGIAGYNIYQKRKARIQQQLLDTEMKALRAQMNPHFIFNCLNSIHGYIQDYNFKSASGYLLSFSKLTRTILENSQHAYIPLSDELKAMELYLDLEIAMLDKQLNYKIEVSPTIDPDTIFVPPMIIQPFIENAVLYGLSEKGKDGQLNLFIQESNGMLQCIIDDNGIGRTQAQAIKTNHLPEKKESLGMKLTEQRIAIINKIKKAKGFISVTDKRDDMNRPAGTKVELMLPLNLQN